jgi:polygalacturonase
MTIRRLAAGLLAVPALVLGALASTASASTAAAVTTASVTTASVTTTTATAGADQAPPGIGDPRDVTQPALPATTCATLQAQLPGRTRVFSAADEAAPPDTARIQAALDACTGSGGAVVLASGPAAGWQRDTSFLSSPLTVHAGEYLVVDAGVTLFATRDAAAYQETGSGKATCGSIGTNSTGCNPFIAVNGDNAGVEGTVTRTPRGEQWGTIDGRGDMTVLGTDTTWYQIAATATAEGLKQVNPRLIQATSADNVTFYHVKLVDAAKQHLFISKSVGATVWDIEIATPDDTLNTDGVDVDSSTDVTVADSNLMEGDDCVALTTNSLPESDITVRGLHCYGTHGLSIGSGTTYGLNSILFLDNTLNGYDAWGHLSSLDNGIRVKSYEGAGGLVTNVVYADTCMKAIQNLILITPFYDPPTGTSIPWFQSVTVDRALAVHSVAGASSEIDGFGAAYPTGLTLHDVYFDATAVTAQYANVTLEGTDLDPSGTGVTDTTVMGGHASPMHCAFPKFPGT